MLLPVNVIQQVNQHADRHDAKIDLLPEFLLDLKLCERELPQVIAYFHRRGFLTAALLVDVPSLGASTDFVVHDAFVKSLIARFVRLCR